MNQDQCHNSILMTDKQVQESPAVVYDRHTPSFPFLSKKKSRGYVAVSTDDEDDHLDRSVMGGSPPYGVVIKTQPPVSIVKPGMAAHPLNDHFLTLSIVLSVICFMCGTWYSLFCTVPAIIIATSARKAEVRGNLTDAHGKAQIALLLNMIALVTWIVALVVIVLGVAIVITGAGSKGQYCKINENYNYYQCN